MSDRQPVIFFLTYPCHHRDQVHVILGVRPARRKTRGEARIPRIAWTSKTGWW